MRDLRLELLGGVNIIERLQWKIGAFRGIGEYRVADGSNPLLGEDHFNEGGFTTSLRFDNLGSVFFPTAGLLAYARYDRFTDGMGSADTYSRWYLNAQGAWSFGATDANTIILTARSGQALNGR